MIAILAYCLVLVVGLGILFMIVRALPPEVRPPENIVRIVLALIGLVVLVLILNRVGLLGGVGL